MVLKLFTRPHNNFPPTANAKIRHFQTHLTFSFLNIFLIFLKKTSQHRKGIFFHRQSVFIGRHLHGLIGVHSGKNNSPPGGGGFSHKKNSSDRSFAPIRMNS